MSKFLRTTVAFLLSIILLMSQGITLLADNGSDEKKDQVDIATLSASDWMGAIPDEAYVSSLNVPGSHDSGLHEASVGVALMAECQKLTIREQLEAGVRFFDIRLRYNGNPDKDTLEDAVDDLYVCHGQGKFCCNGYICIQADNERMEYVNYTYAMILDEMATFLEEHPTETIFYFTRYEYFNDEEKKNPSEKNKKYIQRFDEVMKYVEDSIEERFANGPKDPSTGRAQNDFAVLVPNPNPPDSITLKYEEFWSKTVGDCRGRIYRFQNEYGFGSMMNGSRFNDWDSAYNDKWDQLKPFFDTAPVQSLDTPKNTVYTTEEYEKTHKNQVFRAAWTSCTGMYTYDENGKKTWNNIGLETIDIFDWINNGVGIPTGGAEAYQLNKLLLRYPFKNGAYYGWIAMDMVTEELARVIFQTNDFNQTGKIDFVEEKTYIQDIRGFCDVSYDDAVQRCYGAGYTPLLVKMNDKKPCYEINPKGYSIVLGYKTTTDPNEAITDIVGRYDSNEPGNYKKVIVKNSMYNNFTRGTFFTKDTYLFVSRDKSHKPITSIQVMYECSTTVDDGMVSRDLDKDKPVGSNEVFNLQEGVEIGDADLFVGLRVFRE